MLKLNIQDECMASTRNRNTPGNYCQEQAQYARAELYNMYPNSCQGAAYNTRMPGNGFLPAQIPGNKLSHNCADIESFLFGIGSTNLVNPLPAFTPELATLPCANVYENAPIWMPYPLIMDPGQRPFPT